MVINAHVENDIQISKTELSISGNLERIVCQNVGCAASSSESRWNRLSELLSVGFRPEHRTKMILMQFWMISNSFRHK